MNKFLIFDMDGVLINSEPFHKEVLLDVFGRKALHMSDAYYNSMVGMANRAIWEKVKADFSLETPVEVLMDEHMKRLFEMLEHREIPQPEGMPELLGRLRNSDIRCSLASSSPMRLIDAFVKRMGIDDLLDHKVSGEQLERSKPFPDIFLKVSELNDADPKNFWVIEDSGHGVKAAVAAGMKCIGYKNPDSGAQDLNLAHMTIDHFDTLTDTVLNTLWS